MHWVVTTWSPPLAVATTSQARDTPGWGNGKSRVLERKEGRGGDGGEEEDAEERRKKAKQGAERESTLESRIVGFFSLPEAAQF